MRTNLCLTLAGTALLATLVAAPVQAGTAIALRNRDGIALVNVPAKVDNYVPFVPGTHARGAEALGLTPDGRAAVAYRPDSREYVGVSRDASHWRFEAEQPSATGWVPGRAGRLLNLSRDRAMLVDPAVGVAVTAPQPAIRIELIDCASPDDGGPSWCLHDSGGLVLLSRDGEILSAPQLGASAVELGMDSTVILSDDDQIGVFDVPANRVLAHVSGVNVLGLSSDPQSGLLLVQVTDSRFELRELASLAILRQLDLGRAHVTQAALLHGGGGIVAILDGNLLILDLQGEVLRALGLQADEMVVGPWEEPFELSGIDAASQGSVNDVNAKLDARLDVKVSSRASQASVDQANAQLDATISSRASQASVDQANAKLDATISSRASQASVDALAGDVADANARLDVAISSRASQASVDQANAQLDVVVSSRASQASVDQANAQLDATMSSRASQASLDRANGQLDVAVSTRASQVSVDGVADDIGGVASDVGGVSSQVDAVGSDVDAAAADLAALRGLVDVAVSSRASQASLDGVASRVARIDGLMDAPVGSRATQDSVDALVDQLDAATDDAVEAHARLLEAITMSSRRGIENALLSNVVESMFLITGGGDADPALDGATCPGLAPAGHAAVHVDGMFETVRCVTRRAIDAMAAIGEDTRSAERSFADGEASRRRPVPAYRAAVDDYARALAVLSRGR